MSVRRRFQIPEVVQTSAMDCGPASLSALLAGFDTDANYAHLRELCQTDVDGTSIETLEAVARACGLDAEQIMLPLDHLLEPASGALPAIAVVRLPSGNTHFVVLWRRIGRWVQVMDPAHGRSWMSRRRLERVLYLHAQRVAPADVVEWFAGTDNRAVQLARLARLGVDHADATRRLEDAIAGGWAACARLDGAVRQAAELVRAGAVPRGRAAARLIAALSRAEGPELARRQLALIGDGDGDGDGDDVRLRGVVLVRVRGRTSADREAPAPDAPPAPAAVASAVLADRSAATPAGALRRLIAAEPRAALVGVAALIAIAGAGLLLEPLLLRGVVGVVDQLQTPWLRGAALVAAVVGLSGLLLFDVSLLTLVAGLGRRLELRLRVGFLARLPQLEDRYFRTRLTSDLAQRAHQIHLLRGLPDRSAAIVRVWIELGLLGAALTWLAPARVGLIAGAVALAIGLPLAIQPWLRDLDLRARTHGGVLMRFFLDALLGAVPIHAHRAAPAIARQHESLLVDWLGAGRRLVDVRVVLEGALFALTAAPMVAVVGLELGGRPADGSILLLVYWALLLPQRAATGALLLAQLPGLRNTAVRLAEPLASAALAPEAAVAPALDRGVDAPGVAIELHGVTIATAGRAILRDLDLRVAAGEQLAVVGRSGAGKSTLLGLLLGWQRPSTGRLVIDGAELDGAGLDRLRRRIAWIDPAVQLWSGSLFDNLLYGADADDARALPEAIEGAALREVLELLPAGLQSPLGEGGRLLSGGEGQRVRLGRALVRRDSRLVLLDEPFRGLDGATRERLLGATRRRFAGATLIYVTHDIGHALEFDRVLVVDDGAVVEDGVPRELAADPSTHFAGLRAAELAVRASLWGDVAWRRLRIEDGALTETHRG